MSTHEEVVDLMNDNEHLRSELAFMRGHGIVQDNAAKDASIAELQKHVEQLQAKLHCMCGSEVNHSAYEGHSPVSMYDYALDQAEARAEQAEAQLAEAAKVVRKCHDERDQAIASLAEAKSALSAMEAKVTELDALDRVALFEASIEQRDARIASLEKSVTVLGAERNAAFKLLEPRQVWDIRLALAQATDQPTTAEP